MIFSLGFFLYSPVSFFVIKKFRTGSPIACSFLFRKKDPWKKNRAHRIFSGHVQPSEMQIRLSSPFLSPKERSLFSGYSHWCLRDTRKFKREISRRFGATPREAVKYLMTKNSPIPLKKRA